MFFSLVEELIPNHLLKNDILECNQSLSDAYDRKGLDCIYNKRFGDAANIKDSRTLFVRYTFARVRLNY